MDQVTEPAGPARFVVCVRNDDYELDLVPRKIYAVLPDASAYRSGWIRIVDETGEDYLYPASYFHPLASTLDADCGEPCAPSITPG